MYTIRTSMFETNSSSNHSVTFGKRKRSKKEFPLPNKDGIIVIQVDMSHEKEYEQRYSHKGFTTFTDYVILAMTYMSGNNKLSECISNYMDQPRFIKWINIIYSLAGLPKVSGIRLQWNGFLELNEADTGTCSYMNDDTDCAPYLQSEYTLENFISSLSWSVDKDAVQYTLSNIPRSDYEKDPDLYNAAIAMLYNTTSCISENG